MAEKIASEVGKERYKIWKATRDSKAGFMITDKGAMMAGSKWNFFAADEAGVHLAGQNISFVALSENVHRGGVFKEMNDFVRMLPQTIVTPNSNQQPDAPIGFAQGILKDLPTFIAAIPV